jgi:hypothetical protein
MDQRVGVPMHLPPLRSVTAKDPGVPQRPVLARQSTNFATAKEALNRLFGPSMEVVKPQRRSQ